MLSQENGEDMSPLSKRSKLSGYSQGTFNVVGDTSTYGISNLGFENEPSLIVQQLREETK
jgi:hypothetical protein